MTVGSMVHLCVLESKSYGVGELRSWCWRVTVMALESNGHSVEE
jgi:hypothetical protein